MAITYMTKDGYKKKMEEIAFLESVERPRISAAIAEARDKGDLSENSEYDAAKEAAYPIPQTEYLYALRGRLYGIGFSADRRLSE